jgi:L-ascorbate metabolism protein UlaG (beta-lactamase superfamily)
MSPGPDQVGALQAPGDRPPLIIYHRTFAYHDNVHGTLRGPDTITVMDVDGVRICHLGDLGELQLTPQQLASIGRVDILMIPVGGFYTIDGNQAVAIVRELKPKAIIPMHYGTPALNPDLQAKLAPATVFLAAMKTSAKEVTIKARDLDLTPGNLPTTPTIYILRYE